MNDFFDLPTDSVSSSTKGSYEKKIDENLYDPNPDAASGGVYKSVFRFIPNLRDKGLSKFTKYSAKIYNPLTKKSMVLDCPSNEGKPSVLWTLSTILGRLYKEEPTIVKEINKNFSRWYTHHSYVYIANDPQKSELNGTIKVFKYRAQINDLIEHQINPEEDGLIEGVSKVNPFHLLEGKDFLCVVSKKTKEWRDWTKCKFMDEITPFRFKIADTDVVMKNEPGAIKLVTEFFEKTAPTLDEYQHVSWTDETYTQVAEALKAAIGYKEVINMLISETRDEKMKTLLSDTSTASNNVEDTVTDTNDVSFAGTTENTVTESVDTSNSNDKSEEDEYKDIFADL